MSDDTNETVRARRPWVRLSLIVLLVAAWGASLRYSLLYCVPLTPWGRLGDGSSSGYDNVRSFGLAYGSLAIQMRRRTTVAGWDVYRERDFLFRLWPFRHGWWPIRTFGVPLPLLFVPLAATLIPWRRLLGARSPRRGDGA